MQWSKKSATWSLCLALGLGASSAYGQTAEAKAEELFNKAVELSEQRNYAEACPLLAESHKLDPRASTMFALADCERLGGKIASAVEHFRAYLKEYDVMKSDVRKRHGQRANSAKGYIKSLEPQLPMLKMSFFSGIPDEFVLTIDGKVIHRISLDKDFPVDPGDHLIVVQVPGRTDSTQRISIANKEKKNIDLVVGPVAAPNDDGDESRGTSPRKKIGFIVLGTGAAGLIFGGVMGGLAVGKKNIVDEHCTGLNCDADGFDAVNQGRTFGNLSTVGFAAGGVLAAVGAVLIITAPKSTPKTSWLTGIGATATAGGAFVGVEGRF